MVWNVTMKYMFEFAACVIMTYMGVSSFNCSAFWICSSIIEYSPSTTTTTTLNVRFISG